MFAHWTHAIPRAGHDEPAREGWGLVALWRRWAERIRQRRALAELDDRLLADCGLTREEVRREIEKPFWIG